MNERDKYVAMWGFELYRSYSPGESYVQGAVDKLITPGSSVIDFGCGTGRAANKLAELGCRVVGVDFADNCLDGDVKIPLVVADLTQWPHLRADYGFCCDVMEHIPTHQVDDVLAGIARSVKGAFFSIALQRDSAGRLIGETLHMTVQPSSWWKQKLSQHFGSVDCINNDATLIAVCRR